MFAENYDWDEQHRVRLALAKLCADTSPELWEEMLKHTDDNRYLLTMKYDGGPSGHNYTIGYFLLHIVTARAEGLVEQHLPVHGEKVLRLQMRGFDWGSDSAGRNADRHLYDVQLRACEVALDELKQLAKVDDKERQEAIKGIESEIAALKATNKPVLLPVSLDAYDMYSEKQAREIRAKVGESKNP